MRKLRVLVVDDNLLFLSAVRNLLSGLPEVGCAEYVNSGAEALARAAEFRPDLVLMDIVMPGMNGLEAMRALRDRVPAPRIYAVTLHDSPEMLAAALKNGAADLIPKHEFAEKISGLIAQLACDEGAVSSSC